MPLFTYTAKSDSGEIKTGSMETNSEADLAHSLREEGFILTSVQTSRVYSKKTLSAKKIIPAIFGRVPLMEKILFAEHLAVMIGAGLSLSRALEALAAQIKNKTFAKIVFQLNEDIKKGVALADALAKYPKVFSDLFVNMVRVGETSGNMEEVLKVLAEQMKKDYDLRSRVKGAMIYPAVIICAMIIIGILMMIFVVPKLMSIFKEMDVDLPFTTKLIITISGFLSQHWLLGLLVFIGSVIAMRAIAKTKQGNNIIDIIILRLPVFGDIVKKVNSARLARTLGSLIKSGVPIVQGLQIVAGTLGNSQFKKSLEESAIGVQKGQTLSQILKNYPHLYPSMVNQMIQVGEETGTLDQILLKLAEFYENAVDNVTRGMASIVEPILMIVIGAAVGFFAVSMLQPMYAIMDKI